MHFLKNHVLYSYNVQNHMPGKYFRQKCVINLQQKH